MDADGLRNAYVGFFEKHGHKYIRSAPLVPENDPTVLFTTAGMHPLVPYLLGEKHPSGSRLVDYQKCIRTGDIDEVGDASHLTFFEMLGNWSLGDYFKKESIEMSYEFLKDVLKMDMSTIVVTAFEGAGDVPKDEETFRIWKELGIPEERIFFCGMKDNWWGPAGQTGPCGPDTEIFYDDGREACSENCGPSCGCGKYTEIWNNVFMEYFKDGNGSYVPLSQKNVDTGMGLERTLRILNGKATVYDTELFSEIISKIEEISGKRYGEHTREFRIIADHLRAATFMTGDGVAPAKVDRGYILRRLIRRASRYLRNIGVEGQHMKKISEAVIEQYGNAYPELKRNREFICSQIAAEEEKFGRTLTKGLRVADRMIEEIEGNVLPGDLAFRLYDTYGFPIELTTELVQERGLTVDIKGYEERFREHQDLSRAGAEQKFKGGLADNSDETTKLHTATHLLNAALGKVLGPGIQQKGSNITPERLRFDFNFDRKLTPDELKKIEDLVNDSINADIPVICEEMPYEDAKKSGAIGVFEDKYSEIVKIYTIGNVSKEMCGGPHVSRTGEIGTFKIKKEESSAAGVRRIKAVIGQR